MANATNLVGVHRHGDELCVTACDHENGATVNLTLEQARTLRRAIGRIIRDIESNGFAQGRGGLTVTLSVRDRRYTPMARLDRTESVT